MSILFSRQIKPLDKQQVSGDLMSDLQLRRRALQLQNRLGKSKLTPPEIARMWGIKSQKVIAWIRSGELRAINAAENASGYRPRFLVDVEDLALFELQREAKPVERRPRRKRRGQPTGFTEYF